MAFVCSSCTSFKPIGLLTCQATSPDCFIEARWLVEYVYFYSLMVHFSIHLTNDREIEIRIEDRGNGRSEGGIWAIFPQGVIKLKKIKAEAY